MLDDLLDFKYIFNYLVVPNLMIFKISKKKNAKL